MICHSASVCTTASGSSCSSFADGARVVGMQGCRKRGGGYIQRLEKSTALDQVWHGFWASEPPWFRWFGAAKVCKPARPSPAAGSLRSRRQPPQNATLTPPSHCAPSTARRCALDRSRATARSSQWRLTKPNIQRKASATGKLCRTSTICCERLLCKFLH